jgi:flagellin
VAFTAGGVSFTYTAANATATAPNANQEVSSLAPGTGLTQAITSGSLTITAAGKSFTYAAGAGNTVGSLVTAINASTDATGAQAFLDSAGKLNIVDPNNNGNLAVTTAGTVATTGLQTVLGTFSNPVVNVTNPNQQVGSVAALTGASVLTAADTVSITADGKTSTFTNAAASTVSVLLAAINTGATSGGVVLTGTANTALHAFLDANGKLNVTDSSNGNNVNVVTAGQTATDIGTFAAAPQVVAPTVQTLINAINADTTVGAKAALVGGQLQITDPLNRADIAVSTTDSVLGAPVNGAPTNFTNPNTVGTSTINTNELIGNKGTSGTPITADTTLTNGAVTSFTAGGKTFTFTAGASSTVGDLIAALNNPNDPAGLHAYIGTATGTGTATQLIVVDPNANNNVAVGATNTETLLGTFTNPSTTGSTTTNIFLSDSTAIGSSQIAVTIGGLSTASITNGSGAQAVSLSNTDLSTQADAQTALIQINAAISNVASTRGTLGASVNRLTAASNVINSQVQNLTSAENTITAADIPAAVANLTKYSILEQTGISALAQANQQQQLVLKLLQ